MIIVLLLFREGEKVDIFLIFKNFGMILFLVFGGVILIFVGVGVMLLFLLLSVFFVVCFVFGVVLGLIDVVVVSLFFGWVNIFKKVMYILEGEGLLNDVFGVIVF